MTTPAAFWSKIGQKPGVEQSPLQDGYNPAAPTNTSIPGANGSSSTQRVTKDIAPRISTTTTPSSGSWADSMEEEEARVNGTSMAQCTECEKLSGIIDYQGKRIKQLESVSAGQINRIAELEAQASGDSRHIAEIEHTMEFRAYYIEELTRNLESKHNRCVAQDTELHNQNQRIKNLMQHTAEKDRLLAQLEGELDTRDNQLAQLEDELSERDTVIDKLELHIGELTANKREEDEEERDEEASIEEETYEEELAVEESGEETLDGEELAEEKLVEEEMDDKELDEKKSPAVSQQKLPEDMPIPDDEPEHLSAASTVSGEKTVALPSTAPNTAVKDVDGPGPAASSNSLAKWKLTAKAEPIPFNLEDFPILGCPKPHSLTGPVFVTPNTIKSTAPVAPPKQLKMAVDLSKFAKKPQNDPVRVNRSLSRESGGPAVIDSTQDVRKMSKEERVPFGNCESVQIVMGNDVVATVPKYMFMQCSQKANQHWQRNPTATSMRLPAGSMTQAALDRHVEWMKMHTHCSRVFSVSVPPEGTDRERLEVVQVARVLGLHRMYVAHFTRKICDKIREGVTFELAALIEELTSTSDDPIFDCLANNSAMSISKASPKELENWKEKLLTLPKLTAKIQKIDSAKKFAFGKSTTPSTMRPGSTNQANKPGHRFSNKAEATTTSTNTAETDPDADWLATEPAWV